MRPSGWCARTRCTVQLVARYTHSILHRHRTGRRRVSSARWDPGPAARRGRTRPAPERNASPTVTAPQRRPPVAAVRRSRSPTSTGCGRRLDGLRRTRDPQARERAARADRRGRRRRGGAHRPPPGRRPGDRLSRGPAGQRAARRHRRRAPRLPGRRRRRRDRLGQDHPAAQDRPRARPRACGAGSGTPSRAGSPRAASPSGSPRSSDSPLGEVVGWKVRFTDQVGDRTAGQAHDRRRPAGRDRPRPDAAPVRHDHPRRGPRAEPQHRLPAGLPRPAAAAASRPEAGHHLGHHRRRAGGGPLPRRTDRRGQRARPTRSRCATGRSSTPTTPDADPDRDQVSAIVDAVDELVAEGPGDILVFLAGEREIRDTADALAERALPDTEILQLYSRLSAADQHKVFAPHTGRRDRAGHQRRRDLADRARASATSSTRGPRASRGTAIAPRCSGCRSSRSARPRRGSAPGRCGRLGPRHRDPALHRGRLRRAPGVHRPRDPAHQPRLGAAADGRARPGRRRGLPVRRPAGPPCGRRRPGPARGARTRSTSTGSSPRPAGPWPRCRWTRGSPGWWSRPTERGVLDEVLVIAAGLTIQDPRERPTEHQQAADELHARFADEHSDFLALLNLWRYLGEQQEALSGNQFRRTVKREFLHYLRIREWQDLHGQLRGTARRLGMTRGRAGRRARRAGHHRRAARRAALAGRHAGRAREGPQARQWPGGTGGGSREYLGTRNTRFVIAPGTPLAKKPPRWVVAAELVETSRLFARTVARIDPEERREARRPPGEAAVLRAPVGRQARLRRRHRAGHAVRAAARRRPAGAVRLDRPRRLPRAVHPARPRAGGVDDAPPVLGTTTSAPSSRSPSWRSAPAAGTSAVDDETLFELYDARVPADVVSTRHFDRWWKTARRQTPDLLTFTPGDAHRRGRRRAGARRGLSRRGRARRRG